MIRTPLLWLSQAYWKHGSSNVHSPRLAKRDRDLCTKSSNGVSHVGLRSSLSIPLLKLGLSSAHPRPGPLAQLLGFPFSNFEQTLIHKYALQPPSSLPPASVPIIQDLVCVRLIQSGQYASAVKLDRRFAASIIPGTTSKMQKSIQDRRKMMDEVLATLPTVERTMVEAELEAEAAGGGASDTSSIENDEARADKFQRSWENGKANGSVAHAKTLSQDSLQIGPSPAIPISARNDMPRFGGSVSHPPEPTNGNTFVPIPVSSPTPSQIRNQLHQSPSTSHSTYAFHLSSSQSSRTPAPLLGSSEIKYPTPLFTKPATLARASPAAKPTSSLFTLAGSANQTRNAFYTPPVTNGVKRSLGEDKPRSTIDVPPSSHAIDKSSAPIVHGDVNMESKDGYLDHTRETNASHANEKEDAVPTELSYSVFGSSSVVKQPPFKSRRIMRGETEMKMPPGAYVPDEDELTSAAVTSQNQTRRRKFASPPPPPPVKRTRNSSSRTEKLARDPDLKRSVPGAFLSEEDNEEEDDIAPLPASPPPSKRPTRKGRSTKRVGSEDEDGQLAMPTRRSTRLSATSSVASTSPEPQFPRKVASKVKKSARSSRSTGSRSGSRKK